MMFGRFITAAFRTSWVPAVVSSWTRKPISIGPCTRPIGRVTRFRFWTFTLLRWTVLLRLIALPHDWCGYGRLISAFQAKYGIKVNELNPDAGSGDETNQCEHEKFMEKAVSPVPVSLEVLSSE